MAPAASPALPLCVAAAAALLALTPPRASAADPAPPPPSSADAPEAPPAPPGATDAAAPAEDTWLDVGHAFVEQRLFAPILRLDRFFSDERELEAERSRSFVRVRNSLRVHDGTPVYTLDLNANLRFPSLNRRLERLRLVIAGQTEEAVSTLLPDGPAATLRRSGIGRADAGLRFGAWEGVHSRVDLSAGAIVRFPPGVFGRVRHRASVPVRRLVLLRSSTSVFWRTDTRFGASLDLGAERPLGRSSLARLEGGTMLTERSRGVEWRGGLALLRGLTPRAAVSLGGGLEGASRAPVTVDRYRVYTRLRSDLLRRWLFVELEPEAAWPWSPDRGRFRELAVTLRLEIQFQGNEPPPPLPRGLQMREEPAAPPASP